MKKSAPYIFIFLLTVIFAVYPFQSASAQAGGYVGAWGGYTISPYASTDYYNDDHHHWYYYNDYDLDIDETYVLGAKLGFVHPQLKYLAFEFEYSYMNPDIKRSIIDGYGSDYVAVDGDIKLNNFMFNVIAKYHYGIVHPYVGAGIGLSLSDVSAKATENGDSGSALSVGDNYTAFAWQLLTGVEIDLAKNLALDFGYHYFATQLKFNDNIEWAYDKSRDVDFDTSILSVGFKFFF